MINNIQSFLTYENIYLLINWGILPFWLMLLIIPHSSVTKILVHSALIPLLLGSAYLFVSYKIYLEGNIFNGFELYSGLENLYSLFSEESFLLIFWLHFLSLSIFLGSWIARDSQKYSVPRAISFLSIVITYFTGPIGIVFYWFFRIFFAKKISFNE
mgnify:CR=1 FL=1